MLRTIAIDRAALVRRLLPADLYLVLKAALLAGIAVQAAQLAWGIVTPLGPLGEWRPARARTLPIAAQDSLIASVNPFFRDGAPTAPAVASLPSDLKLFGVRDNVANGSGGAIIGTADGKQVSVAVGEEVQPGVRLVEVGFDFAVVERGGARQRIFLDQDKPAETLGSAAAAAGPAALSLRSLLNAAPRLVAGRVSGVIVTPAGDGALFRAAGLESGDVIVSVNGAAISSPTDAAQLANLAPGTTLAVIVERRGQQIPLSLHVPDSR